MSLPDLKALDKLISLMRKRGVTSLTSDGISLTLAHSEPEQAPKRIRAPKAAKANHGATPTEVPSDGPTDEDMMFWSSAQDQTQDN